jgi:hypothetical protein
LALFAFWGIVWVIVSQKHKGKLEE